MRNDSWKQGDHSWERRYHSCEHIGAGMISGAAHPRVLACILLDFYWIFKGKCKGCICVLTRSHLCGSRSHLCGSRSHLCGSRSHLCGTRSHLCGTRFASFEFSFKSQSKCSGIKGPVRRVSSLTFPTDALFAPRSSA